MKKKSTFIINFLAIVVLFVIAVVGWSGNRVEIGVRAGQLASWPALTLHKILISTALAIAPEDELQQQIDETQKLLDMSVNATKPLESEVQRISQRISSAQATVNQLRQEQEARQAEIKAKEAEMSEQYQIFSARVDQQYRQGRLFSPIVTLVSSWQAGQGQKAWRYSMTLAERDKKIIEDIGINVIELQQAKAAAAEQEKRLISLQNQLNDQKAFFEKEIEGAKAYQATLQTKIAELSAEQKRILAEKYDSAPVPKLAVTSLGGCKSDIGVDPGFSNAIGFFSYGVPNKIGLNQYGAKGRAESGQSYEEILKSYYENISITDYSTDINIVVSGKNEYGQVFENEAMNIEEYLKHLYEMPPSWPFEALKAQVIAARSYAIARTQDGKQKIPPNQSGQVVKKEKNSQSWIDAVNSTKGKVMVQDGKPITSWYSSTHGGVVLKSSQIGWSSSSWTKQQFDTPSTEAGSFSELKSVAFDRQSPWFYCDWGYRSQYNNTAWLKEKEVVDIVNSFILWELDHNLIVHLGQPDQPTHDTWNENKVVEEINKRGADPITNINSISVDWSSSGISKTIRVNGKSFDAQKFKNMFNLRAPANIQIKPTCQPDSGLDCGAMYGLYNVERQ
jgi:SpoIID/LytB domain protein